MNVRIHWRQGIKNGKCIINLFRNYSAGVFEKE
jgi:hypothetical protein